MIDSYTASPSKRDRSPVVTVRFMASYGLLLLLTSPLVATQSLHLYMPVHHGKVVRGCLL